MNDFDFNWRSLADDVPRPRRCRTVRPKSKEFRPRPMRIVIPPEPDPVETMTDVALGVIGLVVITCFVFTIARLIVG